MDFLLIGIVVGVLTIAMVFALVIYLRSIVQIPPDKALVVYGKGDKAVKYKFYLKGHKFVAPMTESYGFLPLKTFTMPLEYQDLWTKDQNRLTVAIEVEFKLRTDQAGLEAAAQNFFMKDASVIKSAFEAKVAQAAAATIKEHELREYKKPDLDALSKEWSKHADEGLWPLGLAISAIVVKDLKEVGVVVSDIPSMKDHLTDLKSELAQLEGKLAAIDKTVAK